MKICFENQKKAIFKGSLQNLRNRYGKTIWLGFISKQSCTSCSMHPLKSKSLTLFYTGSGTYVVTRRGAIMAWIDFRRHRFTQRPPTTLHLPLDKYFDLWLSIDTKNSPLCDILLWLRAVKWRWSKMKIFKRKNVEISNFWLQKCYTPQKKAENIYNKDSARKSKIYCKKSIFFRFFDFLPNARGPPKIFDSQFSYTFKKNPKMAYLAPVWYQKEQSPEFWVA